MMYQFKNYGTVQNKSPLAGMKNIEESYNDKTENQRYDFMKSI